MSGENKSKRVMLGLFAVLLCLCVCTGCGSGGTKILTCKISNISGDEKTIVFEIKKSNGEIVSVVDGDWVYEGEELERTKDYYTGGSYQETVENINSVMELLGSCN